MKGKLVAGLALLLLLLPSHPEPPLRSGAFVQDVTPGAAKICWIGDRGAVDLAVAPEGGGAPARVEWVRRGGRSVAGVSGLVAGTRYRYAASRGGVALADLSGSFVTPPASVDAKVRFAVVGDSGGLPWWVNVSRAPPFHWLARADLLWTAGSVTRIGQRLAGEQPDFWVHVGDVVYPRGEHRHYGPGFFAPFAEVLRRAPCYPVLGNHDWEWDYGRPFLANFELPADADEQFFSLAWGPVRIVGINLNHSVGSEPGLAYLRRALATATEPWRIVVQHFPIWSGSRQGDRQDLIEREAPVLSELRVDLLLTGHDHVYQRFARQGGVVEIVTGGGGKSLYDQNPHAALVQSARAYHYCMVEVDAHTLTLRAVDEHGAPIDEFSLTR